MSTSLVYGREGTVARQVASLLHCYKWAWAQYLAENVGKVCPYDFDSLFETVVE